MVTLNSFVSDTEAEYEFIRKFCEDRGCEFALAEVWGKGGDGGKELAEKVLQTLETKESHYHPIYSDEDVYKRQTGSHILRLLQALYYWFSAVCSLN